MSEMTCLSLEIKVWISRGGWSIVRYLRRSLSEMRLISRSASSSYVGLIALDIFEERRGGASGAFVVRAGLGLPREAPTRLIQPRITNASISSLYSPSGISWQRSKRISCTFCSRTVGVVGAGRDGPFPVSSARRCCMATTCAYIDARSSSFARGCWAKRSLNSRLRRCAASRHTRLYSSRRLVAAAAS
jgi:hypothetical protein